MDAKEYIKLKIREYDSTIDTSPGSPIGDLFINPLSSILKDTLDFEDHMLNNLSLQNIGSMSDNDVDAIAANFLVSRDEGEVATGYVRFFYNTPQTVTIPANTFLQSTSGYRYKTVNTYTITRDSMLENSEYFPLYHSGDVAISAISAGEAYATRANTITNLVSSLDPYPASVRNLAAVTSGSDREDNSSLRDKIINSVNNKSIASADGIKRALQESFPSITSLTVVGSGDTEMVRDITYSGSVLGNYYTSDLDYKVSGLYSYPHNESIAYVGRFQDTDETTAIALPDPEDFVYEFTNDMYAGIYRKDDPTYAELGVYNILEENFDETTTSTGYKLPWVASDASIGKGILRAADEIKVDENAIKLGIKEVEHSPTSPTYRGAIVSVDYDAIQHMIDRLNELVNEEEVAQAQQDDISGGAN